MQPGYYLTGLVLAVAALHLITRGINFYSRNFKSAASPKAPTKRSDWYMFFYCSDLTGKTDHKSGGAGSPKAKNKTKDTRPSARQKVA